MAHHGRLSSVRYSTLLYARHSRLRIGAYRKEYDRILDVAVGESKRIVDARNGPHGVRFQWQGKPCTLKNAFGTDLQNEGES